MLLSHQRPVEFKNFSENSPNTDDIHGDVMHCPNDSPVFRSDFHDVDSQKRYLTLIETTIAVRVEQQLQVNCRRGWIRGRPAKALNGHCCFSSGNC